MSAIHAALTSSTTILFFIFFCLTILIGSYRYSASQALASGGPGREDDPENENLSHFSASVFFVIILSCTYFAGVFASHEIFWGNYPDQESVLDALYPDPTPYEASSSSVIANAFKFDKKGNRVVGHYDAIGSIDFIEDFSYLDCPAVMTIENSSDGLFFGLPVEERRIFPMRNAEQCAIDIAKKVSTLLEPENKRADANLKSYDIGD